MKIRCFEAILALACLIPCASMATPAVDGDGTDSPFEFVGGILDLREADLREPVKLSGEVPLYWQRLASHPDSLRKSQPLLTDFYTLWNDVEEDGEALGPIGYGSYLLQIILPQGSAHYAAVLKDVHFSYSLYQDGVLLVSNGKVAANKDDYRPEWRPQMVDFYPTASDTLSLVLQVANFHHSRGGVTDEIIFGEIEVMHRIHTNLLAYDLILTGCLLMGGLFFLGLYFFGRHEQAILWFSLFCVNYSYRIIGAGNYVLHSLIDNIPWWLAIRLEYITLYVTTLLFARFILHMYPQETSKLFFNIIRVVTWVAIGLTIFLPTFYFSQVIRPYVLLLFFALPYAVWVYMQAWATVDPRFPVYLDQHGGHSLCVLLQHTRGLSGTRRTAGHLCFGVIFCSFSPSPCYCHTAFPIR